jgi:hypothetical protein
MQPDSVPPFGRDLLIHAARMRAGGISWQTIARGTGFSALELARLPFDHAEIWEPLYKRAEKLQLQEAEGEGLKALNILLDDKDQIAAEKAARELLTHRRHIERRRYQPQRHRGTENQEGLNAAGVSGNTGELLEFSVPRCLCGEKEAPAELEIALLAAARGVALGEAPGSIARETGHDAEEIARWAFIYAKAWDRAYWPARLEAAEFCAALAINRLLDFVAGPDAKLAARAGRTLLVHRRHMHWARERSYQPQRPQRPRLRRGYAGQAQRTGPGSRIERPDSPESSAADISNTPLRLSAPSAVKRFLPRSRDGP